MKTKAQKGNELKNGRTLLDTAAVLVFTDFSGVKTGDINLFRQELKHLESRYFVIKKRLLNLLLKERGSDFNPRTLGLQIGTVFSEADLEAVSPPIVNFFTRLGGDSKSGREHALKKILGAYDLKTNAFIERDTILYIGQLPSRPVLLSQLLGMIAAPIRSFLYIVKQKSETLAP